MKSIYYLLSLLSFSILISGCQPAPQKEESKTESTVEKEVPEIQHRLSKDQTHNKFSSTIEPVLRVSSGAVIEAFTEDASDEQLLAEADLETLAKLSFEPIHPITGPVYV